MCIDVFRWSLVTFLLISCATTKPLSLLQTEHPPLAELSSRVAAHSPRLQDGTPRLPLPSAQEIDAIKKVAQILIMLGGQVIPGIIGETPSPPTNTQTPAEIPHDPVSEI